MHRWLVVLSLISGCSFGLSGPDPLRPRNQLPECDTSKGLVVLDAVAATTAGLIGTSVASQTDSAAVVLLPVSIAAIYVVRNPEKLRRRPQ